MRNAGATSSNWGRAFRPGRQSPKPWTVQNTDAGTPKSGSNRPPPKPAAGRNSEPQRGYKAATNAAERGGFEPPNERSGAFCSGPGTLYLRVGGPERPPAARRQGSRAGVTQRSGHTAGSLRWSAWSDERNEARDLLLARRRRGPPSPSRSGAAGRPASRCASGVYATRHFLERHGRLGGRADGRGGPLMVAECDRISIFLAADG